MSRTAVQFEELTREQREEIDQQVERILGHPLFQGSKRLPIFLRYIVEVSLRTDGGSSIKERTLGVEVFGRKPDYDNNSDPVVRVTATELRKKLAQYYYEAGELDEIRVELPPGSYVARFRRVLSDEVPARPVPNLAEQEMAPPIVELSAAVPTLAIADEETPAVAPARPRRSISGQTAWGRIGWSRLAAVLVLLLCLALGLLRFGRSNPAVLSALHAEPANAALDHFWSKLAAHSNSVIIVLPVVGSDHNSVEGASYVGRSVMPNLTLEDADVAARLVSQVEHYGMQFQMISAHDVTLDRLQTAPAVLVGALDNVWSMRLMQGLPLTFEEAPDHRTGRIRRNDPAHPEFWTVDIDRPHARITRDYGIIASFTSHLTGQPVVVVAGISSQGTQAAGRMLTSQQIEPIRKSAGDSANFEALLETEAIDGHAGQPQLVTLQTW